MIKLKHKKGRQGRRRRKWRRKAEKERKRKRDPENKEEIKPQRERATVLVKYLDRFS